MAHLKNKEERERESQHMYKRQLEQHVVRF